MFGVEDYASDSDGEGNEATSSSAKAASTSSTSSTKPSGSSSGTAGVNVKAPSSSNGLSLPPPRTTKKSGTTKKILFELPKLSKRASDEEDDDDKPAAKRVRVDGEGGARSSGLLSMLPAPKRSTMELPAPKRVLGGGRPGVMYSSASSSAPADTAAAPTPIEASEGAGEIEEKDDDTSQSLLPPSLLLKGKGKAKPPPIDKEAQTPPVANFFAIGSVQSERTLLTPTLPENDTPKLSISAAPTVEEYRPPSPTIQDSYPGYYQLPSGQWAMHDPAYYKTYTDRWAKEYEAQIRKYEKEKVMDKGFEGAAEDGATVDVTAEAQRAEAAREREEKKALTRNARLEGERPMPKMNINPQKIGGLAGRRHQLSSLLTDAYMNREVLEEKIAQGKRNRKEAGNKYGF